MSEVVQPARMRISAPTYMEAVVKRLRRLPGIHRVSQRHFGRVHHVEIQITYTDGDVMNPDPVLRERVDEMRREFSAAFPDWGISAQWLKHFPIRVRKVSGVHIDGSHVIYELECGHEERGERIKTKRRCTSCSDGDDP